MKTITIRVDQLTKGHIVLNTEDMVRHDIGDLSSDMITLEVLHVKKYDLAPIYFIRFDTGLAMLRGDYPVELVTERLAP